MTPLGPDAIPAVGLVAMPAARYHADPCAIPSLSSHCAATIVTKSPLHAWHEHPRLGGAKRTLTTTALRGGSLAHELLLRTAGEVDESIVVIEADNFRTKAAQAERDEAIEADKLPVLAREFDKATIACGHILARFIEYGIHLSGLSEVAAFWQEVASDGALVQCRALMDHVIVGEGLIYDLKSCRSAHPRAIQKAVESYSYHIQSTAYTRALEQIEPRLAGRVTYRWLFVELTEPYVVVPAEPAGSMRALGKACWTQALDTWAACSASGQWPAYSSGEVLRIEASPWALERAFEEGEVAA
jgi:hypothetical protein